MKWTEEEFMVVSDQQPLLFKPKQIEESNDDDDGNGKEEGEESPESTVSQIIEHATEPKTAEVVEVKAGGGEKGWFSILMVVLLLSLLLVHSMIAVVKKKKACKSPPPMSASTINSWLQQHKVAVFELYEPSLGQISHDVYRWGKQRGTEAFQASGRQLVTMNQTLKQIWWPALNAKGKHVLGRAKGLFQDLLNVSVILTKNLINASAALTKGMLNVSASKLGQSLNRVYKDLNQVSERLSRFWEGFMTRMRRRREARRNQKK